MPRLDSLFSELQIVIDICWNVFGIRPQSLSTLNSACRCVLQFPDHAFDMNVELVFLS
jgi:hypothetical protein